MNIWKYYNGIFLIDHMTDNTDESLFVTEFPKGEFGIVDYLQGRVHFALMDQMKLMHKSGMTQNKSKKQ